LLANGAKVNAQANDLSTPLHIAAYLGNADATRFLLQNNADMNAKNKEGRTALTEATAAEEAKTIEILKAAGAQ
jgi:ankyrin repeat protein